MPTPVVVGSSWDFGLQDLDDVSVKGKIRHKILMLCDGIDRVTANRVVDLDEVSTEASGREQGALLISECLPASRRWNPSSVCCSSWQKQWFGASNVW